jgi:hypothetical protein
MRSILVLGVVLAAAVLGGFALAKAGMIGSGQDPKTPAPPALKQDADRSVDQPDDSLVLEPATKTDAKKVEAPKRSRVPPDDDDEADENEGSGGSEGGDEPDEDDRGD